MAQYRTGDQNFYRNGKITPPDTVISLPAGVEPSRTWEPLDDEAKKAMAKLKKADAERFALAATKGEKIDASNLDAVIERLVAKRVEAALAQAVAGEKPPKGKKNEEPPVAGGRASDSDLL